MSVPSRNLAKTERNALTQEAVSRVLVWEIGSRENIVTKVRIFSECVVVYLNQSLNPHASKCVFALFTLKNYK